MAFVLDASVTMAWCFEDEAMPATEAMLDRLRSEECLVPTLWPLEAANVLLVAERRGRLNEAHATHFVTLLRQLPINVDLSPPDFDIVLAAGRAHKLTAHDAAYFVLAERKGLPLATVDEALCAAGRAAGIPLLGQSPP